MSQGRRGRSGGPGTAAGVEFQSQVAAWFATAILAGPKAAPLWDWGAGVTFQGIELETEKQTDDLTVKGSTGGRAYVQAKSRVTGGRSATSALGKAVDQFVRQFLEDRGAIDDDYRLVLAVGPESSAKIRTDLPRVLGRIRALESSDPARDAARNQVEREILGDVIAQISRAWRAELGTAPTDDELKTILSLLRVTLFEFAEDGASRREALNWLRGEILRDKARAEGAWDSLSTAGTGLAVAQSKTNLALLQRFLSTKGYSLTPSPGFAADVERLRQHSQESLSRLLPLSQIVGDAGEHVRINRAHPKAIRELLESGPLVLTGEPGAGKSAALFEVAEGLTEAGRDVVLLTADVLDSESLGALREELNLDHDVVEILDNWPGTGPGLLLVDALDAARGAKTQQALTDLLGAVARRGGRWRVGASMRRFDLRYSIKAQMVFESTGIAVPAENRVPEFSGLNHFNVPLLSVDELAQLASLAPRLAAVIAAATPELQDLVRTPFNLRLLAELVAADVASEELQPISTQLQLLDKYWAHRVLDPAESADGMEATLRCVLQQMLEQRSMRADRAVIQADSALRTPLTELLRRNVLTEEGLGGQQGREVLAFSHHVLFDYAIARLRFRVEMPRLVELTAESPDLVLLARPSYELHFRHLWGADPSRDLFWAGVLEFLGAENVTPVAKVIPAGVAALLLETPEDFAPLVDALASDDKAVRSQAVVAFAQLVWSRLMQPTIPADRREVWSRLAKAVSAHLDPDVAYPLRALLMTLLKAEEFDERQPGAQALASASRALLEWGYIQGDHYHRPIMQFGLEAVAKTCSIEPELAEVLLRQALEPARLEQHGFIEMPALAGEIKSVMQSNPELARDVYAAAFEFEEESTDNTQMRGGVLALSSNKRQDYEMAHYLLAEAFPQFLESAPRAAIEALTTVRLSYARRRGGGARDLDEPVSISVEPARAFQPDHSGIWDSSTFSTDDEQKMVSAFQEWAISRIEKQAQARELTALVLSAPRPAVILRRLILAAAREPAHVSRYLVPVLEQPAALTSPDLAEAIAELLPQGFAALSKADRRRVEKAVMGLPDFYASRDEADSEAYRERGEQARDELLLRLPGEKLESAIAKRRVEELERLGAEAQPFRPAFQGFRESGWSAEEEYTEQGIDVDEPTNRRTIDLTNAVEQFARTYANKAPEQSELEAVLPKLDELVSVLKSGAALPVKLDEAGWSAVADAAATGVRWDLLEAGGDAYSSLESIILDASAHAQPEEPESFESFDRSPSWGSTPRGEAAQGLMYLAYYKPSDEILERIKTLSKDAHHVVRFQILRNLSLLRGADPELMWKLADDAVREEQSLGVLSALLRDLPRVAAREEEERLVETVLALYGRATPDRPGSESLEEGVVHLLTDLYLWRASEDAGRFIRETIVAEAAAKPRPARHIIHRLRSAFTAGEIDDSSSADDATRRRTIELSEALMAVVAPAVDEIENDLRRDQAESEDDPRIVKVRELLQIADGLTTELYFATGAFDEKQGKSGGTSIEQRRRLYMEAGGLLDQLSQIPIPTITHHALETLESCIPFDPRGAFLRIGETVKAGRAGGYQGDSLGAGLVAKLIERYFAEYRTLLQEDAECRQLVIEILGIFIEAGWPEALQLVYGMDELYR